MAITVLKSEQVTVSVHEDVVQVRQKARQWAAELGFGLVDQTKIVTATSELARNMVVAAGGGLVTLEALNRAGDVGLRLAFEDEGPGIPNVELAMQDGYSTGSGLGLGLGGSRRLVDEFEITSTVDQGTSIRIVKWK